MKTYADNSALCSVAVMGGTFDPPHFGHAIAIRGLFDNPGVRKVLVIPSGTPPLKPLATSAKHRLEMIQLLLQTADLLPFRDRIELERIEIEASLYGSAAPSYSIDTLRTLGQRYGAPVSMVIGTDQLIDLPRWKGFSDLLEAAHWIILRRKGHFENSAAVLSQWSDQGLIQQTAADQYKTLKTNKIFRFVDTPAPELSSTHIREQLNLQMPLPAGLLPDSIISYLKMHRLYGTP